MEEDDYRDEEASSSSSSGDEQEQTEAAPQETFRQGYGSGKRRTNVGQRSYGGNRDRYRGNRGGGGYGRREGGYGRDRFRGREDRGPVPVEEGQELTLKIDALGRRGDGIARLNNFVIFVPGAKAGEQVKIRITTVRGSFATGEIVS